MTQKRTSAAIAALAAIAVVLPAASALASVSTDARFRVKAEYAKNPEIYAYAGVGALAPDGESPEESKGLFSYTCGSMTIDVTEEMLASTETNWDRFLAGDMDGMKPGPANLGAIQAMNADGTTGKMTAGGDKPAGALGFSVGGLLNFSAVEVGPSCSMNDFRSFRDGDVIRYNSSPGVISESRLVSIQGELLVETYSKTSVGIHKYERHLAEKLGPSDSFRDLKSDTIPFMISYDTPAQPKGLNIVMKPKTGEYDSIHIIDREDGLFEEGYIHRDRPGVLGSGVRPDGGPERAIWDASGSFMGVSRGKYEPAADKYVDNIDRMTVAQWNASKGTSWNGKHYDIDALGKSAAPSFKPYESK